jgi:glycerol-3-phosphate acyltransferase PlsY
VMGHCFPVWLRFRGGKGVATGLGVALAVAPLSAVCGAAVWVVSYKLLRISSVGSLAGAAVALLVSVATAPPWSIAALAGVAAIVVVRHRSNVQRLLRHEER